MILNCSRVIAEKLGATAVLDPKPDQGHGWIAIDAVPVGYLTWVIEAGLPQELNPYLQDRRPCWLPWNSPDGERSR